MGFLRVLRFPSIFTVFIGLDLENKKKPFLNFLKSFVFIYHYSKTGILHPDSWFDLKRRRNKNTRFWLHLASRNLDFWYFFWNFNKKSDIFELLTKFRRRWCAFCFELYILRTILSQFVRKNPISTKINNFWRNIFFSK